jgi:PKD repeat protein
VEQHRQENSGPTGFWASLGAEDFVFDPVSLWDPFMNRFVIANSELASDGDYICLAVSKTDDPNAGWWIYRWRVSPTCGFPDFPNLGLNDTAIFVSTDCFGGGGNRVFAFDKAIVANGLPLTTVPNTQTSSGFLSLGDTKKYDSGSTQYLVSSSASSSSLSIVAVTNPLSGIADQTFVLPVTPFAGPPDANQQGSSNQLDTIDERTKNGVVRNGHLYSSHTIGESSTARTRWYDIDLRGWPSSGSSPVLAQSGTLNLGAGVHNWFADVGVTAGGDITLAYSRSSSSTPQSIRYAVHLASDPPGVMNEIAALQTSSAPYNGGRWGDYAGVDEDPAAPGTFWSHLEFSQGQWATWVDTWSVATPPAVASNFNASPTSGDAPLTVSFTDASTGPNPLTSWSWTFGDGGTSTLQNPVHTYTLPGLHTVSLLAGDGVTSDLETKVDFINVDPGTTATCVPRNDLGNTNPNVLTCLNTPVLGTTFMSRIDAGSIGGTGLTIQVGTPGFLVGSPTAFGVLLVDLTQPILSFSFGIVIGGISNHGQFIPNDVTLLGLPVYVQGYIDNVGGAPRLTNGLDLVLGN